MPCKYYVHLTPIYTQLSLFLRVTFTFLKNANMASQYFRHITKCPLPSLPSPKTRKKNESSSLSRRNTLSEARDNWVYISMKHSVWITFSIMTLLHLKNWLVSFKWYFSVNLTNFYWKFAWESHLCNSMPHNTKNLLQICMVLMASLLLSYPQAV